MRRFWRSWRKEVPDTRVSPGDHDASEIATMLRELGIALVEVDQPTNQVTERLQRIAGQYTTERVRIVVLPTALVLQIGNVAYEVERTTRATTQLNLAARIDDIAELAEVGAITPADAIAAVTAARTMPPRFRPWLTLVGYVITAVGFGMIINPTWAALPGYVFLAVIVGGIVELVRPFPSLTPVVPTLSAMIVTMLAAGFVADTANDGLLRVISPALVALLPGLSLTIAAMELATGSIIAGTSRLASGLTQLMLLVFGVALGLHIAGAIAPHQPSAQMGTWALYAAIPVIGVGLYWYLSAPRGSLFWLTGAVGVALIGQQIGGLFLDSAHSGAVGAFLSVPFAMLAGRVRTAPPSIVMLLVAFWTLVPGALSFETLGEAAAGGIDEVKTLGVTIGAIISIALGTLLGWSVFRTIAARPAAQRPE